MSATTMDDCKESVYNTSVTANSTIHVNATLQNGRTLTGGAKSLLGRQICMVDRQAKTILAHCVVGKACCDGSVVPVSTTGHAISGSQNSHDDSDGYSSSALIVGIVVAAFVLIGLAAYTYIQRRRRNNQQWARVAT